MRALLTALWLTATCCASAQNITGYEYWLDQDDTDRTLVNTTALTSVNILADIDLGDLTVGHYTIHYRLRDSNDHWSSVISKPFSRVFGGPYELVSGEYWFDTNDATPTPFALVPGQVVSTIIDPDASGLAQGHHKVHYRLVDNHGFWSSVISKPFSINPGEPYELVLLRYWSDPATQTPSDLTEVTITPPLQYLDIIDNVLFCNWSTAGLTDVYFQLKDNHGQWSAVIKENYDLDLATMPPAAPDPIAGPIAPPFGSTQTYSTSSTEAGYYDWILPVGWTGSSNSSSITVQVGNTNPDWMVGVAAINGCGTSDTTWLDITTAIRKESTSNSFQLFPNPTNGEVILIPEESSGHVSIQVFNSTGVLVQDLQPAQRDSYVIDLSTEANGLYSLLINQGDETHVVKLVIQQ